jgi:purine-binding chemotaxis protein CheW
MHTPSDAAGVTQLLTFQLAGEVYALDLLRVREIIQYQAPTRVPHAPPAVRGVMNLRGSVLPVVDLAVVFRLPPGEVTRRTCVVVVEVRREEGDTLVVGIVADRVEQVIDVPAGAVEPPPSFGTQVRRRHLAGLARLGEAFALVLDVDGILVEGEMEDALAAAAEDARQTEREASATLAEAAAG